ncbi:MAG: hypothetical protein ACPG77_10975 [Nannocystaceae bacterium]
MFSASEGRYPTKAEQSVLREWAARLDARLAAVEAIEAKEESIVRQTVSHVFKAYPDFEKRMRTARESCTRDLTLVLRYATQAMLRGDMAFLDDSLLSWMATILRGIGFAPEFIRDTYLTLERHANLELNTTSAELIQPYLHRCMTVLSGEGTEARGVAS